jgi:LEA14-like dessication related protein
MEKIPLYFKDGTLFANDYIRIVTGERGSYVELSKDQIIINLKSHFNQSIPLELSNEDFYYYWLEPINRNEKIYWQIKTVKYADYKRDLYYINPILLTEFTRKN